MHSREFALFAFGPRDGADNFMLFQIVLLQNRSADFPAIRQLGGRFDHQNHEPVQRICFVTKDPRLLVAFAQLEVVDGLPRSDIDDLDIFEGHVLAIESFFVLGELDLRRRPGFHLDLADHFFGGFVDDGNVSRPAAHVKSAVSADQFLFSAEPSSERKKKEENKG